MTSSEGQRENPLDVLMIAPQFRPIIGGYERAAERLAIGLVKEGHHVDVVTERRDSAWPVLETLSGVRVRRLWCLPRRGLHVLTALGSLAWFLLREGRSYHVWHVHQVIELGQASIPAGFVQMCYGLHEVQHSSTKHEP